MTHLLHTRYPCHDVAARSLPDRAGASCVRKCPRCSTSYTVTMAPAQSNGRFPGVSILTAIWQAIQ